MFNMYILQKSLQRNWYHALLCKPLYTIKSNDIEMYSVVCTELFEFLSQHTNDSIDLYNTEDFLVFQIVIKYILNAKALNEQFK